MTDQQRNDLRVVSWIFLVLAILAWLGVLRFILDLDLNDDGFDLRMPVLFGLFSTPAGRSSWCWFVAVAATGLIAKEIMMPANKSWLINVFSLAASCLVFAMIMIAIAMLHEII